MRRASLDANNIDTMSAGQSESSYGNPTDENRSDVMSAGQSSSKHVNPPDEITPYTTKTWHIQMQKSDQM